MKKTSSRTTGSKHVLVASTEEIPAIHKELKGMVNKAEYDLDRLELLKKEVDPITADQIQVVIWDALENEWPDYELNN